MSSEQGERGLPPVPVDGRDDVDVAIGSDFHALAERLGEPLVLVRPGARGYANAPAARLLEMLDASAPLGQTAEALLARLDKQAAVHGGALDGRITLTTAQGYACTLQITEVPLAASAAGAGTRCVLVRDVSAADAREAELQRRHDELQQAYRRIAGAQEQLLQSEKMASIGQLAAGVAHEINNPIGYVSSNLATLQDYTRNLVTLIHAYERALPADGLDDASVEIAELRRRFDFEFMLRDLPGLISESREGIDRVIKIVQDLKEFSYAGRGEAWVMADLHRGLDSTINIVWNDLKYKVRLHKEYGDLPPVQCLPSELNQVFMNILVNAGHAIRERGNVWIRTHSDGTEATVEIRNDGDPIPEAEMVRLFDPFFTTKPVGQGSGLGLSISYGIVSKHHGRIEVESSAGRGTCFRVVVPLLQPGAASAMA